MFIYLNSSSSFYFQKFDMKTHDSDIFTDMLQTIIGQGYDHLRYKVAFLKKFY